MKPGASPLKAAVIGCGRMGVQQPGDALEDEHPGWFPLRYANAITSLPAYELVGLCDIDADLLAQAGRLLSVDALYSDYRKLFTEAEIDVVVIATRTPGRSRIVSDAVKAGIKAIHAEKPLGRSLAECRIALDAVEQAEVPLTLGTIRRYMATFRTAKRMIEEGAVGALTGITVEYGRNSLMWTHPHSVDLLVYFSGTKDFDFVCASMAFDPDDIQPGVLDCDPIVDDLHVRFSNGIDANITPNDGGKIWLFGTEASLLISDDGERLEVLDVRQIDETDPNPQAVDIGFEVSATQRLFIELDSTIRAGTRPSITTGEIYAVHQIMFGAALSAMSGGKPVFPDDIPPPFTVSSRMGTKTA